MIFTSLPLFQLVDLSAFWKVWLFLTNRNDSFFAFHTQPHPYLHSLFLSLMCLTNIEFALPEKRLETFFLLQTLQY